MPQQGKNEGRRSLVPQPATARSVSRCILSLVFSTMFVLIWFSVIAYELITSSYCFINCECNLLNYLIDKLFLYVD